MGSMTALFESVDLGSIGSALHDAETNILGVMGARDEIENRLAEISAIQNPSDRLETIGSLWKDTDMFLARLKAMSEAMTSVKKRIEAVGERLTEAARPDIEYLSESDKPRAETDSFVFKIVKNPPSVVIDNLGEVPKKYRLVPAPPPEWKEWPINKNMVKDMLVKKQVHKIDGVHLDDSKSRVEVKVR